MENYVTWASIAANIGTILAIIKQSNAWEHRLTKLETKLDMLMTKGAK